MSSDLGLAETSNALIYATMITLTIAMVMFAAAFASGRRRSTASPRAKQGVGSGGVAVLAAEGGDTVGGLAAEVLALDGDLVASRDVDVGDLGDEGIDRAPPPPPPPPVAAATRASDPREPIVSLKLSRDSCCTTAMLLLLLLLPARPLSSSSPTIIMLLPSRPPEEGFR